MYLLTLVFLLATAREHKHKQNSFWRVYAIASPTKQTKKWK